MGLMSEIGFQLNFFLFLEDLLAQQGAEREISPPFTQCITVMLMPFSGLETSNGCAFSSRVTELHKTKRNFLK